MYESIQMRKAIRLALLDKNYTEPFMQQNGLDASHDQVVCILKLHVT